MVDRFITRVKGLFDQVSKSDTVKSTVATARDTATDLAGAARKTAEQAVGKAKAAVTDASGKDAGPGADHTPAASGAESNASEPGVPPLAGPESDNVPEPGSLSPSAQATIDQSRQQSNDLIRDSAVELDAAPESVPADATGVDAVTEGEAPVAPEDLDDAVGRAKSDTYQE